MTAGLPKSTLRQSRYIYGKVVWQYTLISLSPLVPSPAVFHLHLPKLAISRPGSRILLCRTLTDNTMISDFECTLTECKKIEEALRKSDGKFRSLFDHVNDGLLILDQDGYIRDANRTAYERLGYSKDSMLGMHISQLNAPKHTHKLNERLALVRAQGQAIFESAHVHRNGTTVPVEVNVRAIELDGELVFFSVCRDLAERKNTERMMQMMQQSIDHMGDGAFWLTPDGSVAYANEAACRALGYTQEEMLGLQVFDIDPDMNSEIWPFHWESSRKHGSRTLESTHRAKCGKSIPVEITVNHVRYEDEEYHCTFVRDISARKQKQRSLQMMQFAMDNMSDAVFWTTPDGLIAYANIAACQSLGYAPDEIMSMRVFDFNPQISPDTWPIHWQELKRHRSMIFESTHRANDGRIFPVEVSANYMRYEDDEYVCTFVRDISLRKLTEERISRLAHFDALTGLPNRALLYDRLSQSIALAQRNNTQLAVLFLDLDGFKQINDCHGHFIGDGLLAAVAERLRKNARDMDTVARVGGDEFIFILNEIGTADNAAYVARKIIASLAQTFLIQEKICQIGGSIGIAVFPEDGGNIEDIIKLADDAMYLAKKNGKGKYVFINPSPLAQGTLKLDES